MMKKLVLSLVLLIAAVFLWNVLRTSKTIKIAPDETDNSPGSVQLSDETIVFKRINKLGNDAVFISKKLSGTDWSQPIQANNSNIVLNDTGRKSFVIEHKKQIGIFEGTKNSGYIQIPSERRTHSLCQLASSGSTVIIGDCAYDGQQIPGRPISTTPPTVYFFEQAPGTDIWSEVAKFPSKNKDHDYFGKLVAISEDTAAATATDGVHIFEKKSGRWLEVAVMKTPVIREVKGEVAIDGKCVAFSQVQSDGSAYVFCKQQSSEWKLDQKVALPSSYTGSHLYFGSSLAIKGNTLLLGSGRASTEIGTPDGSVLVYERVGQGSFKLKKDLADEVRSVDKCFGVSVRISADSNMAADCGAAYVFRRN